MLAQRHLKDFPVGDLKQQNRAASITFICRQHWGLKSVLHLTGRCFRQLNHLQSLHLHYFNQHIVSFSLLINILSFSSLIAKLISNYKNVKWPLPKLIQIQRPCNKGYHWYSIFSYKSFQLYVFYSYIYSHWDVPDPYFCIQKLDSCPFVSLSLYVVPEHNQFPTALISVVFPL